MAKKQRIIKKINNSIQENEQNVENKQETHVLHTLAGSLEEAFSEDFSEIDDDDVIMLEVADKKKKHTGKKAFFFATGLLVIVFTIVGIVTTIRACMDLAESIADNKAIKTEFALFLYPVVTTDPPEFADISKLPNATKIKAAISRILLKSDLSNYESDMGTIYIPSFDVENNAKSLFGYGCEITHETVGQMNYSYVYDAEKKTYAVQQDLNVANYWPQITDITSVGDMYTVTVAYMPPTTAIEGMEVELTPDKTMIYTISKSGDMKTIVSITFPTVTTPESQG